MITQRQEKMVTERILVGSGNQAFANSGTNTLKPTSGNTAYNIAEGQLGVQVTDRYSSYYGQLNGTVGTALGTSVRKIELVQGTNYAADINLVNGHEQTAPVIRSMPIVKNSPLWFSFLAASNPCYDSYSLENLEAVDLTEYTVHINQSGVRLQHTNSMELKDGFPVTITSLDYTALGYTGAQSLSDIYCKLGYKANLNSMLTKQQPAYTGNQPFVVLGIDKSGTAGDYTLAEIIANWDGSAQIHYITYMQTVVSGMTIDQKMPNTVDLREALTALNSLSATTGISTSSSVVVLTQDTSDDQFGAVDALVFIALDSGTAVVYDEEPSVKTQIFVTADSLNSTAARITKTSNSFEGTGRSNQQLQRYRTYAKADIYSNQKFGFQYDFIQKFEYVKNTTYQRNYNATIIEHGAEEDQFTPNTEHFYRTIVLIPVAIPLTFSGTNTTPPVAYAIINPDTGAIIDTDITDAGTGLGAQTATIAPFYDGSGATFSCTVAGNVLTGISITAAGSGYKNYAPVGTTAKSNPTTSGVLGSNGLADQVAGFTSGNGQNVEVSLPTIV